MSESADNWYYAVGTQRNGPMALEALRQGIASGQIASTNLVWTDGLTNWIPAASHPELAEAVGQQQQLRSMPSVAAAYDPSGHAYGQAPLLNYSAPYDPYGYSATRYGGFWIRVGAYILDWLILLIPNLLIQFAVRGALGRDLFDRSGEMGADSLVGILQLVLTWLYFAMQESSSYQATLGKRACGLRVSDLNGMRLSFGRATGRYFARLLSFLLLFIGVIMVAWTGRKQGLHDIIAGTVVTWR